MATGCGMLYLCLVTTVTWGILESASYSSPLMASKDGDIIIGGIFPVHESVNFTDTIDGKPSRRFCTRFNVARMLQALMLIEAVESINNSSLLGNVTLGYRVVDSCSDVTTVLYVTQRFLDVNRTICQNVLKMADGTNWDNWQNSSPMKPVDVIIGGYHSEISIAVARQLSIHVIPQISYGSTTGFLSDKSRFPAFMRTVPEDKYQAHAIADILDWYGWNWVGVVTTDGDYGRYIAQRFRERAKEKGICIAFSQVLPDILDDSELNERVLQTIKNIENDPRIEVIVSFAKPDHMKDIMSRLSPNATGRTWLASDNWATSAPRVLENSNLMLKDIGTIIGVTLKSATSASFNSYLDNLNPDMSAHDNNTILQWYLNNKAQSITQPDLGKHLKNKVYPYAIFSVGMAVKAIASALKDLCRKRDCKADKHFEPWMLKNALRNAEFQFEPSGKKYKFDPRGDLNTGYDLILWKQNGQQVDMNEIIAKYSIQSGNFSFMDGGKTQIANLVKNVTSRCAPRECPAGMRKIIPKEQEVCCFSCENCPSNTFTNATDMTECMKCPDNYWSTAGSWECQKEVELVFDWKKPFAIVLVVFSVLGIILTLVVLVLFLLSWKTPVVKASVGPISVLLLMSLLGAFASTVLSVGKPSSHQCQARQVLFGLSFTLCISCVLVKSLKIVLAFQVGHSLKLALAKLFQPYLVIGICVSVQVVICAVWLTKSPPRPKRGAREDGKVVLLCEEGENGNFLYFGLMLGYIGVLSLAGFVIAFKGRNLPDCFNEAKYISFGLLIYLICWVMFGPIYAHAKAGVYQPAVQMIVILFSAYGLLGTLFLPKCYVILFKRDSNTREAFLRCIREHNCRESQGPPKVTPDVMSNITLMPSSALKDKPLNSMCSPSSQVCLVPMNESRSGSMFSMTQVTPISSTPCASGTGRPPCNLMPIKRKKRRTL